MLTNDKYVMNNRYFVTDLPIISSSFYYTAKKRFAFHEMIGKHINAVQLFTTISEFLLYCEYIYVTKCTLGKTHRHRLTTVKMLVVQRIFVVGLLDCTKNVVRVQSPLCSFQFFSHSLFSRTFLHVWRIHTSCMRSLFLSASLF